jgi:hypothetical protein
MKNVAPTNETLGRSLARIRGNAEIHQHMEVVAVRNGEAVSKLELSAKDLGTDQSVMAENR